MRRAELEREREIVDAAAAAWQAHHEHLVQQAESARLDGQRALQALTLQHQAQQDALQVRLSTSHTVRSATTASVTGTTGVPGCAEGDG